MENRKKQHAHGKIITAKCLFCSHLSLNRKRTPLLSGGQIILFFLMLCRMFAILAARCSCELHRSRRSTAPTPQTLFTDLCQEQRLFLLLSSNPPPTIKQKPTSPAKGKRGRFKYKPWISKRMPSKSVPQASRGMRLPYF